MGYSVKAVSYYFIEQSEQVKNSTKSMHLCVCDLYVACYIVPYAE